MRLLLQSLVLLQKILLYGRTEKEYPLVKLEISSFSHPFFTGKMKFVDTAGRIDKFNKKFAKTKFAKKES